MTSPIISIRNLTKTYSLNTVLNDLNWEIKQGDIVGLVGKNGAGKSTLLETIMNLRDIDFGELRLWNKSWSKLPQSKREKISFVSQDIKGFEWMKVKDFLNYIGGFFPSWDREYCNGLRDRWNLDPDKKIRKLSGGQAQILHVIQALSIRPELMILDEPVAHLDPSMRRQFLGELIELTCEFNSTVVFSSHIVSDLERVANKVAFLKDGKIAHYHQLDDLKANIAQLKIASEKPLAQSDYYQNLTNWQLQETGATAIIISPVADGLKEYVAKAPNKIEVTPISLEDWYLEVSNEIN